MSTWMYFWGCKIVAYLLIVWKQCFPKSTFCLYYRMINFPIEIAILGYPPMFRQTQISWCWLYNVIYHHISQYPPTTIKCWLHGSIPSHYCWLNTQTKLCFSCTPINTRSVGSDGHVHQAPQNLSGCGDLNRFKHQKLWFLLLNIGI